MRILPLITVLALGAGAAGVARGATECREADGRLTAAEAGSLLAAVCDPGQVYVRCAPERPGPITGCGRCPAFTAAKGAPQPFELRGAVAGSFSGAGVTEVLATFAGCEAAEANGGTILLRRAGPTWERVQYARGTRVAGCVALGRTPGAQRAACVREERRGSETFHVVGLLEPGGDGFRWTPVVDYLVAAGEACAPGRIVYTAKERLDAGDLDGDGRPDLTVAIDASTVQVDPASAGQCLPREATRRGIHVDLVYLDGGTALFPASSVAERLGKLREFPR